LRDSEVFHQPSRSQNVLITSFRHQSPCVRSEKNYGRSWRKREKCTTSDFWLCAQCSENTHTHSMRSRSSMLFPAQSFTHSARTHPPHIYEWCASIIFPLLSSGGKVSWSAPTQVIFCLTRARRQEFPASEPFGCDES